MRAVLLACCGVAFVAATGAANAGGFAIREQSAYGQGSSFAGIAAGGDLSSMFWNPAVLTQFPGTQSSMTFTGILPYAEHSVGAGSTLSPPLGGAGNSAALAFVPGSYMSMQLNPDLWLGLSFNAPFGLSVQFPDAWAGRNYAGATTLNTYNAVPTIAYRVNNWLSIGVGVQIEYARADLATGLATGLGNETDIYGNGWGFGFTAGLTVTPTPTTTIGLGYRSQINQKISGTMQLPPGPPFTPAFGSTPGDVSTTLNLPDVVTLSLRQRLDPRWTLLGTVEWSNWSRIGTSTIEQSSGAPATIIGLPVTLPFQYQDGWFFALGGEYQWTEHATLRAGVGYEISPITDDVRTPRLPDNDRFWVSGGMTYEVMKGMSLHAAYSHIFVRDTSIAVGPGNPWYNPLVPIVYNGNTEPHIDIISVGLSIRFDAPGSPLVSPFSK